MGVGMEKHSIYDLESLLAQVRSGFRPEYLFFWGHRQRKDGGIGKQCLSQWWPCRFEIDGIQYPSAEHYMVAEKARLFGDDATCRRILSASHPRAAKKLGRQVKGFREDVWSQHRFDVVVRGNEAKFRQNEELGRFLLSTGDRVLVEASPVDTMWGIGWAAADPQATDPEEWRGLNLLGFALMRVRALLREE